MPYSFGSLTQKIKGPLILTVSDADGADWSDDGGGSGGDQSQASVAFFGRCHCNICQIHVMLGTTREWTAMELILCCVDALRCYVDMAT